MIRPSPSDFAKQLIFVHNYAALRMERSGEIMTEMTDILSFLGSVGFLHPDRTRRTFELLTLVLNVTGLIEMRVKHALTCRRPVEYSPQIQPMIPTPGHGSLPSGHATESFAAAFVFYALLSQARSARIKFDSDDPTFEQLMRIAERIAINRTVAGVHFPVDSVAGMKLGLALAEFYIARFCGGRFLKTHAFDGRGFDGDFCYEDWISEFVDDPQERKAKSDSGRKISGNTRAEVPKSCDLNHLWDQAVAECQLMIGVVGKSR
ncbi:phosphatase PAP2 family protein [Bradyrhizobium sp. HKCCYLRH3061]